MPSIRARSCPYIFSLRPIVTIVHPLSVALLLTDTLPNLAINAGLDPRARQPYGVALALKLLSISMLRLKYHAVKACWEGSGDAATVAGLGAMRRVNGRRLVLVALPDWVYVLAAVVRALGSWVEIVDLCAECVWLIEERWCCNELSKDMISFVAYRPAKVRADTSMLSYLYRYCDRMMLST